MGVPVRGQERRAVLEGSGNAASRRLKEVTETLLIEKARVGLRVCGRAVDRRKQFCRISKSKSEKAGSCCHGPNVARRVFWKRLDVLISWC